MSQAFAVVRNLKSKVGRLEFGEFTISHVGVQFESLRELFASQDVEQADWIFEKKYTQLPPNPRASPDGGIQNDVEDSLLLLRLYKAGDIVFTRRAIVLPSGETFIPGPYKIINDLNSYSTLPFEIQPEECKSRRTFANDIRNSQSWNSDWFTIARRAFLTGGAKQFDPVLGDVDRILDYATALESALVPEQDFSTRRISRRAAALLALDDLAESRAFLELIKTFYDIRSRITHGSRLKDENREWLFENCRQIELRVRQILVKAVQTLPPEPEGRGRTLAALYDPTDEDRGNIVLDKFREIKDPAVRKALAAKIGAHVNPPNGT